MSVILEDGRIRQITGDPDHEVARGKLCGKCALAYNGVWLDEGARLTRPLKRTGRKGIGQFEPISWEEATGIVASRLRPLVKTDQAHKIIHTHYTGTCTVIAGNFPTRFFKRLGATEVDPDTVCNKAGHEALKYVLGTSFVGFDPRTAKDAKCILVWGANPSASAPHAHSNWLGETAAKKILIDPIAHPSAKAADLFLQVRPGADAALAFAMMKAAKDAGLLKEAFIKRHTVGWDGMVSAVESMTPDRAEKLTGVPADLIKEAALLYAHGPSLLWLGQGMQRQKRGGNAFRAAAALCAVTGNIGRPGTGVLYLNGAVTRGVDLDYVVAPQLSSTPAKSLSHMDLASALADPSATAALFCWNNNIVASSPSQNALRKALLREDLFHVVTDIFQTDTVDYADIVLPAANFLEFDDLLFPYFQNSVSAQVKVKNPPGDCLPNQEIFRRLATAMQFNDVELYESDESIIAKLLSQTGIAEDFTALASKGTVFPSQAPMVPFSDLKFDTPSGKIELASERAASDGHPIVPIPHADEPNGNGEIRILSPASDWTMNSSYANDRRIQGRLNNTVVTINPAEAAARGVAEGESVELRNDVGRLKVTIVLSQDVPMGVGVIPKGRWPKLDPNKANVNVLNPGEKTDIGESSCVHNVAARLIRMSQESA
jgi:anaerobic selenocysteine-containing dehydrogenase